MRNLCSVIALLASLPLWAAEAPDNQSIAEAFTAGTANASIRYRYEHVDEDDFDEKANASTARLRLNYRTGKWNDWSAFGEFDNVFHILVRDFNSGAGTSPGRTQYPVIADPSGPDLNQLYVDYSANDSWQLRLGRQRILLDNQRFIGGVGWRQNEQTYDAATLTTAALPKTALSYSYLNYVRRIFGTGSPAGKAPMDSHLLNAKVTINDAWSLVPYFYYLDYRNASSAGLSTATAGLRLSGKLQAGTGELSLVGEVATQSDAADNPVSYDAQYLHVDALWKLNEVVSAGLGFESLGGSSTPGEAFRTSLATLHKFQGWADVFIVTPSAGVEDVYATLKLTAGSWGLTGVYHDFSAETGSADYGSEIDISASRKLGKHYGVLLKAAFFSSDNAEFVDTTKVWLQFTADYR